MDQVVGQALATFDDIERNVPIVARDTTLARKTSVRPGTQSAESAS
jgi:hypothetical protein